MVHTFSNICVNRNITPHTRNFRCSYKHFQYFFESYVHSLDVKYVQQRALATWRFQLLYLQSFVIHLSWYSWKHKVVHSQLQATVKSPEHIRECKVHVTYILRVRTLLSSTLGSAVLISTGSAEFTVTTDAKIQNIYIYIIKNQSITCTVYIKKGNYNNKVY